MPYRSRLGLAIVLVAALVAGGCGRYKEELESAKATVQRLTSENRLLTQKVNQLEEEEKKSAKDLQSLEEQSSKLRVESEKLAKKNDSLSKKIEELNVANNQLKKQLAELKQVNQDLTQKVEELKQAQTALESPPMTPTEPAPASAPTQVGPPEPASTPAQMTEPLPAAEAKKEQTTSTPCDAMIVYMRKCADAIRRLTGDERTRALQALEKEYAAKLSEAPQEAIRAAKSWVAALSAGWDKTSDDTVFKVLDHRDKALKACGTTASEAGF